MIGQTHDRDEPIQLRPISTVAALRCTTPISMYKHFILLTTIVLSALSVGLWFLQHPPVATRLNGHLINGERYLNMGMYSRALRSYSKAISLKPTDREARLGYEKARINYFTPLDPFRLEVLELRIQKLAERTYNDAHVELFRGDTAFYLGDFTTADKHYATAIALAPKLVQARFASAVVAHKLRRFTTAAEEFLRAIELAPQRLCYRVTLAEMLLEQSKADQALLVYKELVRIRPYYYSIYYPLISILLALRRYDEAIHFLDILNARLNSLQHSRPEKKHRIWIVNYSRNRTLITLEEKTQYVVLLHSLLRILADISHQPAESEALLASTVSKRTAVSLSDDMRMILKLDSSKSQRIRQFGELIEYAAIDWIHGNLNEGNFYCGSLFTGYNTFFH